MGDCIVCVSLYLLVSMVVLCMIDCISVVRSVCLGGGGGGGGVGVGGVGYPLIFAV